MVSEVFREDPGPIHALLSSLESATSGEWASGGPREDASVYRQAVPEGSILSVKRHSPLKAGPSTHPWEPSFSARASVKGVIMLKAGGVGTDGERPSPQ